MPKITKKPGRCRRRRDEGASQERPSGTRDFELFVGRRASAAKAEEKKEADRRVGAG